MLGAPAVRLAGGAWLGGTWSRRGVVQAPWHSVDPLAPWWSLHMQATGAAQALGGEANGALVLAMPWSMNTDRPPALLLLPAAAQVLLQATPVVQVCSRCGCRDTPQWRRHEAMLLCNACGIKLMRQLRKVQQQEEGAAPPRKAQKASHGSSAHQRSLSGETPVPSTPAARRAAARQALPAAGATAALFPLQAWQQQQQQQQQLAAAAAAAAATAAAGAAVQLLPPQQLQAAAAAGELAPGVLIRHASTITDLLGGAFELWDFEVPALRPSDDTGATLDELNLFNGGGASGSGSGGPCQPGVQAEVAENGGLQGLVLPSPQQQAAWPRANSGNQVSAGCCWTTPAGACYFLCVWQQQCALPDLVNATFG